MSHQDNSHNIWFSETEGKLSLSYRYFSLPEAMIKWLISFNSYIEMTLRTSPPSVYRSQQLLLHLPSGNKVSLHTYIRITYLCNIMLAFMALGKDFSAENQ